MKIVDKVDNRISVYKGILGALPIVGPMAAEVVGQIIPDQRLDRIESLLTKLEEKVQAIEQKILETRFKNPQFIDLLEDGMQQVARALSEERKEYIASVLKNSLSDDELKYMERKKIFSLLSQLNDVEMIILRYYGARRDRQEEFWKKHEKVLRPASIEMGAPQEDIDRQALQDSYKAHLTNLELLRIRFKKPKKNEFPEFDEKTGMIKATGYEVTHLGRLLLRNIDAEFSEV